VLTTMMQGNWPFALDAPCCVYPQTANMCNCVCLQNEVEYEDAVKLVSKGVKMVLEGANMPSTPEAIHHFRKTNVILAAAKACNAGGVAVSGLEMAQNAGMTTWSTDEVDARLKVRREWGRQVTLSHSLLVLQVTLLHLGAVLGIPQQCVHKAYHDCLPHVDCHSIGGQL